MSSLICGRFGVDLPSQTYFPAPSDQSEASCRTAVVDAIDSSDHPDAHDYLQAYMEGTCAPLPWGLNANQTEYLERAVIGRPCSLCRNETAGQNVTTPCRAALATFLCTNISASVSFRTQLTDANVTLPELTNSTCVTSTMAQIDESILDAATGLCSDFGINYDSYAVAEAVCSDCPVGNVNLTGAGHTLSAACSTALGNVLCVPDATAASFGIDLEVSWTTDVECATYIGQLDPTSDAYG